MPRWLQTLLLLREDQLIRWGRASFWICVMGAVFFALASLFTYRLVNVRLAKMVEWQVQTLAKDAEVLSADAASEKRLLASCRMVGVTYHSAMGPLKGVWFLIAAFVPFCLACACCSLKMRSMALELQRLSQGGR